MLVLQEDLSLLRWLRIQWSPQRAKNMERRSQSIEQERQEKEYCRESLYNHVLIGFYKSFLLS